jgi:hypothetical protein
MNAWNNEAADREAVVLMVQCLLPTRSFSTLLPSVTYSFLHMDPVWGIEVTYSDLLVVNQLKQTWLDSRACDSR